MSFLLVVAAAVAWQIMLMVLAVEVLVDIELVILL